MAANFERNVGARRGAQFVRSDGGEVLFQFVSDPATVIGPRPARSSDQSAYPDAWAAFLEAESLGALDRDADGRDGGSLPKNDTARSGRRPRQVTHDASHDHSDRG